MTNQEAQKVLKETWKHIESSCFGDTEPIAKGFNMLMAHLKGKDVPYQKDLDERG